MQNFKEKKITVMGIGLHGGALQMIRWLSNQGAKVIATDIKSQEELAVSLEKISELKNVTLVLGRHRKEDFQTVDMIIKNPSVPWTNQFIQLALAKNIPVEMDSSLFFKLSPTKNIIGVTGTKGKTTTATLVSLIIEEAFGRVSRVGMGQEPVINKLEELDENSWVVFELSSWRLSALKKAGVSPFGAVVTNIYPDHLNHYSSMQEYIDDKKYIYKNQTAHDFVVLNWDNEQTQKMSLEAKSKVIFFSTQPDQDKANVFLNGDVIEYKFDQRRGQLFSIKNLSVLGRHNIANVLGAVAVGLALGIEKEHIENALIKFKGVAHRLELLRELDGVAYYNDTAATTPESAIAGIKTFTQPLTLIAGGSDKNLDLTQLAEMIATQAHVKKVLLLKGDATDFIARQITKQGKEGKIEGIFDDIFSATIKAKEISKRGTVVLLSPGCASFGMFKNEFDRGDKFKEAVKKL